MCSKKKNWDLYVKQVSHQSRKTIRQVIKFVVRSLEYCTIVVIT